MKRFSTVMSLIVLVIVIMVGIAFWTQWFGISKSVNAHIAYDIERLTKIFYEIDKSCTIVGFEHDRNYIDFLTVRSFVGSEVGAMNLARPKNWKGPYVTDNPNVQEKLYEIVRTAQGYFIVPGQGVVLNDGQMIGKDIVFSTTENILLLIEQKKLKEGDKPFAAKIPGDSIKIPTLPIPVTEESM